MCTAIKLTSSNNNYFFGRNMDIECDLPSKVTLVKRGFTSNQQNNIHHFTSKYSVLGTATIINDYPLFFDGFNEEGLACAGLNFPNYCSYPSPTDNSDNNIPVYDVILWILSSFKTASEVCEALKDKVIADIPFAEHLTTTPLHWIVTDKTQSIVIECTKHGLEIHQNPVNVLTNSPNFDFHIANLVNYENLTPVNSEADKALPSIGVGTGLIGLCGDFSSPSRFARAATLVKHSDKTADGINQTFHILDNLAMIKGVVITNSGLNDITAYSCCFDINKKAYYYKTYDNTQIHAVAMPKENLDGGGYSVIDFIKNNSIKLEEFSKT